MRVFYILFLLLTVSFYQIKAQQTHTTQSHSTDVQLLQIKSSNDLLNNTVITHGGAEEIRVTFDITTPEYIPCLYTLTHCNADWTPSGLTPLEYYSGFDHEIIDEYVFHENLITPYTSYTIGIPAAKLRYSGNYAVQVYSLNNTVTPLLTACFSVVENKVELVAEIIQGKGIESHLQKLSLYITTNRHNPVDPAQYIQVLVRQNNRTDNQVIIKNPTAISYQQFSYQNHPQLRFEASNEYRKLEFNGHSDKTGRIKETVHHNGRWQIHLQTDHPRHKQYYSEKDRNGQFAVIKDNSQEYYEVTFYYIPDNPMEGELHLQGEFTGSSPNANSLMKYNMATGKYEKTVYLKPGYYNYQYLLFKSGDETGKTSLTEGNFPDTENEYTIYVYYRSTGSNYDQLIGVKQL